MVNQFQKKTETSGLNTLNIGETKENCLAAENAEKIGRIAEVRKNLFILRFGEQEIRARLKGSFYANDGDRFPVVGDYVTFRYNHNGDSTILSVRERTSYLERPDQAKTGVMQGMAANGDYCFIITSLNEDYSYNRIARYVSIALQGNTVPVVILSKADLCRDVEKYVREVKTISEHLRVHAVSALQGFGMEDIQAYFEPGKTICLLGSSGAGKSTLINTIAGREIMKTSEVRRSDSTGKHTTTHRQLIGLENGVSVIDTPGLREVGMARMAEGIDETFTDILELETRCRFKDCRHEAEPGCAVRAAIESGILSEERFRLFKALKQEDTRNYAKKKEISKWSKEYKKSSRKYKNDFE